MVTDDQKVSVTNFLAKNNIAHEIHGTQVIVHISQAGDARKKIVIQHNQGFVWLVLKGPYGDEGYLYEITDKNPNVLAPGINGYL